MISRSTLRLVAVAAAVVPITLFHLRFQSCQIYEFFLLIGLFTLGPFVLVVTIFALCGLTQSVTMSLFPLYVVHVLGFGLDTVSQVMIVMIAITVITTFFLSRLGHRFEKKTILGFGCITGMLTYSFYFWIPGASSSEGIYSSTVSELLSLRNSQSSS